MVSASASLRVTNVSVFGLGSLDLLCGRSSRSEARRAKPDAGMTILAPLRLFTRASPVVTVMAKGRPVTKKQAREQAAPDLLRSI